MWLALESIFREDGVTIGQPLSPRLTPSIWPDASKDKKASVFVGDAAGRPGDHAVTDRQWAENVGIPFLTPEVIYPFRLWVLIPHIA